MAASQHHKVDNQPLAFSHHKAVVYPWECWNELLLTTCYFWRQPARIREVEFCLSTYQQYLIIAGVCDIFKNKKSSVYDSIVDIQLLK